MRSSRRTGQALRGLAPIRGQNLSGAGVAASARIELSNSGQSGMRSAPICVDGFPSSPCSQQCSFARSHANAARTWAAPFAGHRTCRISIWETGKAHTMARRRLPRSLRTRSPRSVSAISAWEPSSIVLTYVGLSRFPTRPFADDGPRPGSAGQPRGDLAVLFPGLGPPPVSEPRVWQGLAPLKQNVDVVADRGKGSQVRSVVLGAGPPRPGARSPGSESR